MTLKSLFKVGYLLLGYLISIYSICRSRPSLISLELHSNNDLIKRFLRFIEKFQITALWNFPILIRVFLQVYDLHCILLNIIRWENILLLLVRNQFNNVCYVRVSIKNILICSIYFQTQFQITCRNWILWG